MTNTEMTESTPASNAGPEIIQETMSLDSSEGMPPESAALMDPNAPLDDADDAIHPPTPKVAEASSSIPSEKVSKRFAALSRKEKALRERETQLKAQSQNLTDAQQLRDLGKKSPLEVLSHLGLTLDDVINGALGTPQAPPSTDQKLQSLEQRVAYYEQQAQKELQQRQSETFNNQVLQFKNTAIKPLLDNDSDAYELLKIEYGDKAADVVWETIDERLKLEPRNFRTPEETSKFMKETADALEETLVKETRKLASARKISGTSIPRISPDTSKAKSASKTLTNKLTTSTAAPETNNGNLTPDESKKRVSQWLQKKYDESKRLSGR